MKVARLARRAAVVPEDNRAQRLVVTTENDGAMHLAGKTDSGDARESIWVGRTQVRDRRFCRHPPVIGILFGPQRMRARDRERRCRLGKRPTSAVHEDRFYTGCTDVDPKEGRSQYVSH